MKKIFILIMLTILVVGCNKDKEEIVKETIEETILVETIIEETIIEEIITWENVEIQTYIDDEYLKELEFNSQENNF